MALINSPPAGPVDEQDQNGRLTAVTQGFRPFFLAIFSLLTGLTQSGTTAQRPTSFLWTGRPYWDTTLGMSVYWNGSAWEYALDYEKGTWTPIDASGAGLVFATPSGLYSKVGNLVTASAGLQYPITADGTQASVGGLPFNIQVIGAARQGNVAYAGVAFVVDFLGNAGGTSQSAFDATTGGVITNANMSNGLLFFQNTYNV